MDLEAVRSALPKRSTFSAKRVAFFGVVALCVVAGIFLRSGHYSAQPEAEQTKPATSPSTPTATTPEVKATKSVAQPDGEQNVPTAATPSPSPATATSAADEVGAVRSSPPPQNIAVTAAPEQVQPAVNPPDPAGAAD